MKVRKLTGFEKILLFILFCIIIAISAFAYIKYIKEDIKPAAQTQNDVTDSISKAMSQLQTDDSREAEIIKDVKTSEKVAALTFQGLSDAKTNKEVLELLKTYKRKASFFVPGILAAEDTESITAMYAEGNQIESNTLKETKHMEKYSPLELVDDFCNTNHIIQSIVNRKPEVLLCDSTEYTKELLKAAYASGNQKVIKSTHYLNYQSFSSYEQALEYINNLEKGSILTFKMNGVLDNAEYESAERESTPAIDKAPDLNEINSSTESLAEPSLTEQEKILLVVEWVLKALNDTNYQTVFADDLNNYYDGDYDIEFNDLKSKNNGVLANVLKNVKTNKNKVALSFRGIDDEIKLTEILDFLEFNQLQATFFVTADEIIHYPDRIKMILDKQQSIANGGMTGKDLTTMKFDEICLEIYKCDKLLMEKYFINCNLFMPAYGKYNDLVLEAAAAFKYNVATYSKVPVSNEKATLDEIMNKYKDGYSKGDIIYFNASYKQILNVITQIYAFYIKDKYNVFDVETLINSVDDDQKYKVESKIKDESIIKDETEIKAESNIKAQSKIKIDSKINTESKINSESKKKAESNIKVDSKINAESKKKAESKIKAESKKDVESKKKAESKINTKSNKKAESKINAESNINVETNNKIEKNNKTGAFYNTGTTPTKEISYSRQMPKYLSSSVVNSASKTVKRTNQSEKTGYSKKKLDALRKENNNKKAAVINTVHTTEQALSFTFYGVSNKPVTKDVLEKLDSINAKGTFFVTQKDLVTNAKEIKNIADKGHEIGICLIMPEKADYYSVCRDILTMQSQVKKLCGKKPTLVRYAYTVELSDEILEAVSSTGCKIVWQDLALTSSRLGTTATIDDVIRFAFNSGNVTVKRGYIIYIRLDYYKDTALVGKLILNIVKDRIAPITFNDGYVNNGSSYAIKTLGSLLSSKKVYTYPLTEKAILPAVKDAIYPGQLLKINPTDQFNYMKGHYIGNLDVNTPSTLPGFTPSEVAQLDQTGRFTYDRVLFLTFDDWGSDKPITQILYVLNKYKIKANFFVRTSYVQDNPNLLRAISEAGHDVGSHTDKHLPFANSRTGNVFDVSTEFTSLTYDEISQRRIDLLTSYNKLQSIIGDVEVNGRPSLTKIFRPPTLAMSKEGMETVFDMGFQYIVSGDYSTHDYDETDSAVFANNLINGLKRNDGSILPLYNGSILIMHMSDDSFNPTPAADVTAQGLDIAIPKLLAEGYRFARLSDYLSDNKAVDK